MEYVAITDRGELHIEVADDGKQVVMDGQIHSVDMQDVGNHTLFSLLVDNRSHEVLIEETDEGFRVLLQGRLYTVRVETQERQRLSSLVTGTPPLGLRPPGRTASRCGGGHRPMPKAGGAAIRAPMPGLVVSVPVRAGETVSAGQVLIVLESMKMENEVRAPQEGVIQALNVAAGDLVNANQVLLVVG